MNELNDLIKALLEKLDWREHCRIERITCGYSSTSPFQPYIDIRLFDKKPSIKPKQPLIGSFWPPAENAPSFNGIELTPEVVSILKAAGIELD